MKNYILYLLILVFPSSIFAQYSGGIGRGDISLICLPPCFNPSNGGTISADQTICSGSTPVSLSETTAPVGNTGTIDFKWQKSTTSSTSGFTDILGATSANYSPNSIIQTTWYKRIARVTCMPNWIGAAESNVITVTVVQASVGGTVSGGTTLCSGSTSGLLTLSGYTGTIVKWQSSVSPFTTWSDISNTGSTYTSGVLNVTTQFRAVVQRGSCPMANSVSTTVTISPTTIGGTVNGSNTLCSGNTSGLLTLTGNVGSVLKWQSSISPFTTWTDITNIGTSYTSGALSQTTQFRAVVQSGSCGIENSLPATITVNPSTVAGNVTGGSIICFGNTSGLLTLSGNIGSVVKWQSSTSPFSSWTDITNTALTYTSGALSQTTQFRAVVQRGSCPTANSTSTTVTVSPTTNGGTVSGGTSICTGSTSGLLTLTGNVGTVLKWQSSISPFTTWTDITNTALTYTSGALTQTTQFRAIVQSGNCAIQNSASTTVTVSPSTVAGTVTGGTAICTGYTSGLLTLSGNVGTVVKWQKSVSPFTTWTDISNTALTYTSGALTQTTQFRTVVQSGNCAILNSASTTVTVDSNTIGGVILGGTTICEGNTSGVLTISGQTGSVVQWQSSIAPFTNWTIIPHTETTYVSGPLTETTQFGAFIQNGACLIDLSAPVSVIVYQNTVAGTVSGGTSICTGSTSGLLTLTGNIGTVLKWQSSVSPFTTWTDIPNSGSTYTFDALTYTSGALTQTTQFRAVVQSGICAILNSAPTTVTVASATTLSGTVTGGTSICTGNTSGLLTLTGNAGTVLKWQSSVSPFTTWTDISNTALTYTSGALSQSTQFRAVVQSGNCAIQNSASTTVTVAPTTVAGTVSGGTAICAGNTSGLLTLTGNIGTVLKWQSSVSPFTSWTDISNTALTFTSGTLSQSTQFRTVVQSGNCAIQNSASTTVTVAPITVAGTVTGGTSICTGNTSGLLTLTGNVGTVLKWQSSVSPFTTWTDISNTALTFTSGVLSQTTKFRAIVQSGNCALQNSASTTVTVAPTTVAGTVTGGTAICTGNTSGLLTLTGNIGTVLKWQSAISPFTTWTNISNTALTYTSGALTQTTQFRAVVQSGNCATQNSASTTVTVAPSTVAGTVTGGSSICTGNISGLLTLTGNVGTVLKWQSSVSPFTAWTDISNTTLTYTSGALTQTTQFRAVVQSGNCATQNSASTTVGVAPITVAGTVTGGTSICNGSNSGLLTLTGNVGTVLKWQSSVSPFTSWTDISNTTSTYTSGALSQTTQFRAVVQSGNCALLNSASTTVTVSPSTIAGTVNGGSSICYESTSGLLTLTGNVGAIVKWQSSVSPFTTWTDISNTALTYTSGALTQTTQFRAVVQSDNCALLNSAFTTVIVSPTTVAGIVTGGSSICSGSNSGLLTLSGNVGSVTKWQSSVSPFTTWTDISNTTYTYTSSALSQTTQFRAVVQSGSCGIANSALTTVTVSPISVGGSVSVGVSQLFLGQSTGSITLSGQTGNIIKWQKRLGTGAWIDITNTTQTYTEIPNIIGFWEYRAIVQSGSCGIAASSTINIEVLPSNAGAVTGGATPICLGTSTGIMTLAGYTGTILKWQKRVNLGVWIDISNTTITYSEIPTGSGTWEYRAVISNVTDLFSAPTVIIVNPITIAGAVTGGTPICYGNTSETLTLTGNVGSVLRWQSSVSPFTTWTDITNTEDSYTSGILTQNTQFRAVVQSGSCAMANSTSTTVSVSPSTVAGTVTGGTTICSGSTSDLLTLTGNVGTVIKWQSSVFPFTTWTDIVNTEITYTSGVLSQTTQFRAIVQSGNCTPLNSISATVNVFPTTIAGTVTGGISTCSGSTSGMLTLTGNVGNVVKWQSSVSPFTTWTDITNTQTTYTSGILTQSTQFRAVVQSGTCAILNSLPTTVLVDPASIGGSITAPISQIFFGESIGTISLNGHSGTIIKWQKRLDLGVWIDVTNSAATYSETPSSIGLWEYRAVIQSGSCPIAYSNSVIIEVIAANAGSITGSNSTICLGSSTGVLTLSGYYGTIIKWQKRLNSGTWIDIVNTTSIYSETPLSSGTWDYRAIINNGTDQFSLAKTIIVSPASVGGSIDGSGAVCTGNDSGTLTLINQTGSVVKWQKSITPFSSWSDISNTSTIYTSGALIQPTQFRAVVQSGGCNIAYSTPASIQVDPMPTALFDYNATNLNVTFINQSTNATSYSWLFGSASSTSTEVNPTFLYPVAGQYTVILNAFNGQCSATSSLLITVTNVEINEQADVLFNIFPVPTTGKITIQFGSKIMENAQLSVFDITGKMMVNKLITGINSNNSIELDLSELVAGVYRIRVEDNTNVINKAIVIER